METTDGSFYFWDSHRTMQFQVKQRPVWRVNRLFRCVLASSKEGLSVHPFLSPFFRSSIHPFVCPLIHPSVRPLVVHPSVSLAVCPSVHPSIYLSVCSSCLWSVRPFIFPSIRLSVRLSVGPLVCRCFRPYIPSACAKTALLSCLWPL